MAASLPEFLLEKLKKIEPNADFTGRMPRIQSSTGQTYFVKIGTPSENEQYLGEVESLKQIDAAAPGLAPRVLSYGTNGSNEPYFISEYKDIRRLSRDIAEVLAVRMAEELHRHKSPMGFGFEVPTYCGPTRQKNGWYETWEECYDAMIENLLDLLSKKSRYHDLIRKGQEIRSKVIPKLLGRLSIYPSLLHGDLWSGNVGADNSTSAPVIFDPSSYYGHNEADLAIARMFGGFHQSFFEIYHKHCPKTEPVSQYDMRMQLYELYHYLNHTLIFGGGYAENANQLMDNLLSSISNLT